MFEATGKYAEGFSGVSLTSPAAGRAAALADPALGVVPAWPLSAQRPRGPGLAGAAAAEAFSSPSAIHFFLAKETGRKHLCPGPRPLIIRRAQAARQSAPTARATAGPRMPWWLLARGGPGKGSPAEGRPAR